MFYALRSYCFMPRPSDGAATRKEPDQDGDYGQYQQYVNEAAHRFPESYVADQPQHD